MPNGYGGSFPSQDYESGYKRGQKDAPVKIAQIAEEALKTIPVSDAGDEPWHTEELASAYEEALKKILDICLGENVEIVRETQERPYWGGP